MSLPPGFINLLIHDSRTKFALSNWAKSDEILINGYRFNLQDTTLRDLQQDLWRQILRDVLWQRPQLIEIVCPKRWSDSAFRCMTRCCQFPNFVSHSGFVFSLTALMHTKGTT